MKFQNIFETDSITVLPGKLLFDDRAYVGMSHQAGSLTFSWTMGIDQAKAMAEYILTLVGQAQTLPAPPDEVML